MSNENNCETRDNPVIKYKPILMTDEMSLFNYTYAGKILVVMNIRDLLVGEDIPHVFSMDVSDFAKAVKEMCK